MPRRAERSLQLILGCLSRILSNRMSKRSIPEFPSPSSECVKKYMPHRTAATLQKDSAAGHLQLSQILHERD